MLIPKRMSPKKILQYGLLMSFTLGATGYLILKNFVAPDFFNSGANADPAAPVAPLFEDLSGGNEEVPDSVAGISLFNDEKFKSLKDNMSGNVDIGSTPGNVGKKNPFEPPKTDVEEVEQPAVLPEQPEIAPEDQATTSEEQFISL